VHGNNYRKLQEPNSNENSRRWEKEIYLQSDNYNNLVIKEGGRTVAFIRGRLHDLIKFLKEKNTRNILIVRGKEIEKYLEKITDDTEIRIVPLDLNIDEIRAKLSEIDVKPMDTDYIVRIRNYVFRSYVARLEVKRVYAEDVSETVSAK